MKKWKIEIAAIAFIVLLWGGVACTPGGVAPNKSSNLVMKATGIPTSTATSGRIASVNGISLTSAMVNIATLRIEENSGNDVQQGGTNNSNDGKDSNDGTSGSEGSEQEDILLPGPYAMNINDGVATLDQISVYPGTFKKVNFDFQVNSDTPFNGNSISIEGNFTAQDGTIIPFAIKSKFSKQIQLPLANGGITVASNSTAAITIVFDINSWLNGIDFSSAVSTNGVVIIDDNNNQSFLNTFEDNLSQFIDLENE